ncbi:hypothetical protein [Nocardioides dongkuii]|uniref:hypothetical protein n=1 Tax=Nocardioides dongkuii TaxID=2760089 RepID=UPI0015FBE76C|nr:hypothetical protein [Nocardioides dongkuii]
MTYTERERRVFGLLEDNVRTELQIADGALGLGLTEDTLENIMGMITSSVLYAFRVDWSPAWVREGEVHAWEDDGRWYARCSVCLEDSPRADDRQAATRWAKEHEARH